jgi:hypothetical protein
VTSSANNGESRPDASAPASQDERQPAPAELTGTIDTAREPAILVRERDPAPHLAPQNVQLMSEHRILCLKLAPHLERRDQEGQKEAEQRNHRPLAVSDSFG